MLTTYLQAAESLHCTLTLATLLLNFLVSSQAYNNSFYPKMNIWHKLRPGELLHTLDLITADAQVINAPVILPPPPATRSAPFSNVSPTSTPITQQFLPSPPQIQRRIENDAENQYSTEDHLNSENSNEYDYDKAYDQFVQRYFGGARDDALDDVQSGSIEFDDQQPYSAEYESSEPLTASASKSKSRQRCKKVLKNQQECLICKNPKNNEKSETCSFSTETEPETYAYTKEKSFKKHRDSSDESLENDDDADDYVSENDDEHENKKNVNRKNTKQLKRKNQPKRKVSQHNIRLKKRNGKDFQRRKDTNSCTRKNYKYKTCYYCTNLGNRNSSRCFAKEADPSDRDVTSSDDKQNQSTKQIQKSEKKIYKRMVTYSYENGTNFNLNNEDKNDPEESSNIASPRVKRKIIFKLLKHKAIEQN